MDCHAFAWASRLLGDPVTCPQIEICFGNFSARFDQPTCFAITGANPGWALDGQSLEGWRTYRAGAGAVLTGSVARSGLRSYLAVQGGFCVSTVLGSCSTVGGDQLGGLAQGRPLAAGDVLPFTARPDGALVRVPPKYVREYSREFTLRVVPGNQFHQFSANIRDQFFRQQYHVSSQIDRMGCRLQGQPLVHGLEQMASEAVPSGAIQIPGDGQPIVLLRDRQTIGGYPKLGSVYAVDLDTLGQARPGETVRFQLGSLAEAQAELDEFRRFFGWRSAGINGVSLPEK